MTDCIVDFSHYQKGIETDLLRNQGVLGAICKATQDIGSVDETFHLNVEKCAADGLLLGAYHFGVDGNGTQQALHFLDTINGLNCIMVLDWEQNKGSVMKASDVNLFIKTIKEKTGKYPLLYTGYYFITEQKVLDWQYIQQCPLWIAAYNKEPKIPEQWSSWTLWQYTGGAKMVIFDHSRTGIIDRNYFNGTIEDMVKFWKENSK